MLVLKIWEFIDKIYNIINELVECFEWVVCVLNEGLILVEYGSVIVEEICGVLFEINSVVKGIVDVMVEMLLVVEE